MFQIHYCIEDEDKPYSSNSKGFSRLIDRGSTMNEKLTFHKDLFGFALISLFMFLFFFINDSTIVTSLSIPTQLLNIFSIFFSIILKAIPFVLAGAFVTVLFQRIIEKTNLNHPVLTVILSAIQCSSLFGENRAGLVSRLLKQGLPNFVTILLLIGAPFLNPVVLAATYFTFYNTPNMLYARIGLSLLLIVFVMVMIYLLFQDKKQVRISGYESEESIKPSMLHNISDEFFELGKTLLIGAFFVSVVQAMLGEELANVASNELLSSALLMAMAFVLSINPVADAFIALSFEDTFSSSSIVSFLVFGSMFNSRNMAMLLQVFQLRFVMCVGSIMFIGVLCLVVILK